MFGMTQDQLTSAIRWGLTTISGVVSGYLVSRGYQSVTTGAALTTFAVGIAPGLASFIWSMLAHSDKGTIAAAAALPVVATVVTTPAVADSPAFAADPKVVSR